MTIKNLPSRFSKYVGESADGCWRWQGYVESDGYARVRVGDHRKPAHRVIYEAMRGEIPDNLQCDHLCRVRHCVNPNHIELVSACTNVQRGESAKINFETAELIRKLYRENWKITQSELAEQFGLSRTAIALITQGVNWANSEGRVATNITPRRKKSLSDAQVRQVRKMLESGMLQQVIAESVGCSRAIVSKIKHGKYVEEGASF